MSNIFCSGSHFLQGKKYSLYRLFSVFLLYIVRVAKQKEWREVILASYLSALTFCMDQEKDIDFLIFLFTFACSFPQIYAYFICDFKKLLLSFFIGYIYFIFAYFCNYVKICSFFPQNRLGGGGTKSNFFRLNFWYFCIFKKNVNLNVIVPSCENTER